MRSKPHVLLLAIALNAVGLPGAGPDAAGADLVNADFSTGLDGWKIWHARAGATVQTIETDTGQAAQLLGKVGSRVVLSQAVPVTPQCWYRIRYRYRAVPNGPGGGSLGYVRITLHDQNGRFLDYPSTRPMLDTFGAWVEHEQVVKTPLSSGTLTIGFNQSGAADVRVNRVRLEPTEAPPHQPNTWNDLVQPRAEPLWFSAWQYNNDARSFRKYGLKYGWHYVHEEQFAEVLESRAIGIWRDPASIDMLRKYRIPAVTYLYFGATQYRKDHYNGTPPEDIPYMLDPAWHDGYVQACRTACEQLGSSPGLAYVFVQDESYGRWKAGPIPQEKRTSTEFWTRLDDHIRTAYGNGEFGLPHGPDDDNPYRWIAYYTWANERMVDTFRRLREVIDESGTGARLLGPDEVGFLMPLPWCDLARYVDVFTGQCLYARGSAQEHVSGWTTKFARDLTGKPVHNATQVVRYSGCPSPEEVQRQYSEVLQAGGEGQMLIAVEWFDRELNHHRYSAPERWETIKNLLTLMANCQVQTPAPGRLAMLYSSPSAKSLGPNFNHGPLLPLYVILGPRLGAYPTVIDSYAMDKGLSSLANIDLAIVAHMPYETPAVYRQLQDFVARGGTLICTDPDPLRSDTLAQPLPAVADFLGAGADDTLPPQRTLTMTWPHKATLRAYSSNCRVLKPFAENTRVIGTYADGAPAVTLHPVGKGQVVLFGTNPLDSSYSSEDEQWRAWWHALLTAHDIPMQLPIWQLRLPDEALVQARRPEDVCLSGNHVLMVQNGAFTAANDPLDGHYSFSVAPDLWPESAGTGAIAFAEGDLTDRRDATRGPFNPNGTAKEEFREADWANRWSAEALAQGLDLDLELPTPRSLTRLVFWYSGAMGELTVQGQEGDAWNELARIPAAETTADVREITVPLNHTCARLRLQFGPTAAPFTLADLELWGQPRTADN